MTAVVQCVVVAAVLCASTVAVGAPRLPKPGNALQVSLLVAASSKIEQLPDTLLPPLGEASQDEPGTYYSAAQHACDGVTKCVYGDLSSKTTIVLFGDSHAQMWLPALVPVADLFHDRLVLVWHPGCPSADVSVWNGGTHSINLQCNSWRTSMMTLIKKLKPALVLLASRTSDIPGPHNWPTTDAQWQTGLEQTIVALETPKTKVAVVGDITVFTKILPNCLAAYATSVQTCSVNNPNGKTRQHFAAEQAAAVAESAPYIPTRQWLCTTICSPVIGRFLAYFDTGHVSSTYAEYLSKVWATALKPLVKHTSS